MKPRILTRLVNIVAKLAGSPDYDPRVKPITPLEFYADQLPVVPVPENGDSGKALFAKSKGEYELLTLSTPNVFTIRALQSTGDEWNSFVTSVNASDWAILNSVLTNLKAKKSVTLYLEEIDQFASQNYCFTSFHYSNNSFECQIRIGDGIDWETICGFYVYLESDEKTFQYYLAYKEL